MGWFFLCMKFLILSKDKSKGAMFMRSAIYAFMIIIICSMFFLPNNLAYAEEQSIIIEVDGDPHERKTYLERYFPGIDVIKTYDTLFQGIALKAPPEKLKKLQNISFIKTVHPVRTYETQHISSLDQLEDGQVVFPESLHDTTYTGKGVKVGIIDTGIDYHHPDLSANYKGGYDLVDLDEDPMETQGDQSVATSHGTHVAGIIAANGKLKGVAPEADIYAYRALGPGGVGSSVHVIAALEQAVKDGVDVINLSLGNSVNGPDYPTSMAVNRASDLGIAMVIANGNDGPDVWSIGAPATATNALSVGATTHERKAPSLDIGVNADDISLAEMHGSIPWELTKDYEIEDLNDEADLVDKIAISERDDISFFEKAQKAEQAGAVALIIYNYESDLIQGSIEGDEPIGIPVAIMPRADALHIQEQMLKETVYARSKYEQVNKQVAPFSSRGPVAVNWNIKPDILAPGTNIVSTVPGGYQAQQGTSMAAPHVAGGVALLKEAHPQWTNEQIIGALKTTANPVMTMDSEQENVMSQGMGDIDIQEAINTRTIIMNPLLSFGKTNNTYRQSETIHVTIENTTTDDQHYYFSMPKHQPGLTWDLPQSFTVEAQERKDVPVTLHMTTQQLKEDIHQGMLTLNQGTEQYHLPYLFVNNTADYPRAMGLEFSMKMFDRDMYTYKLYVADDVEEISIQLYDPDTLLYDRQLLKIDEPIMGMNEGELRESQVGEPGYYMAFINVILKDGTYETYQTEVHIPQE